MTATNGIVDAILRHAREQPSAIAVTVLAENGEAKHSLTFAEIEERSRAIAGDLLRTAPEAERVMVLQAPGLDFVLSLCACFMAGVAAVPTPPPTARAGSNSAQRFARLFADSAPDAIIIHSDLLARSRWLIEGQIGLAGQTWVLSDKADRPPGKPDWPEIEADDLALLQYTSGSTAEPKGVMIDHANLAANLAAIQAKFELNRQSVVVSWLPPYHDMGLIGGVISALWCGYRVILMDPKHFVSRPLSWLEAIDRFHADVSGGANFAFDLCVDAMSRAGNLTVDLSRWRLAFSGAEPVRAATIERFAREFSRFGFHRAAFYPCYGLAEATLMASGPEPGASRPLTIRTDDGRALVSCGTPCAGLAINIIDPQTGEPLADGKEGEIRVSGSSVSCGYWRHEQESDPGLLKTGDLGFIRKGELYVSGRLKDLIIIRGRNIAPSDIEDAVAMCHPALAPAAAAAFPVDADGKESFVVAAEIRREHRRDTNWSAVFAAMRGRITEQAGLTPKDIVLLRPGTLARTTSGKIRRQACRQAYFDGEWTPLAQSGESSATPEGTSELSRQMAGANQEARWASLSGYLVWRLEQLTSTLQAFLTPDVTLDSVGLDSLKQVEFALLVERDLNVTLPADWMDRATTLSALADVIAKARLNTHGHEYKNPDTTDTVSETNHGVPLTPRQADFFDGNPERPEHFAEILYFRTPKDASVEALKQAVADTTDIHDAFSCCFERNNRDQRVVLKNRQSSAAFTCIDVSRLDKSEFSGTRVDVLKQIFRSFSLDQGPLVSAVFLDQGAMKHGMLAVGFHHLVIDAVSLSAWTVRFQDAYTKAAEGQNLRSNEPRAKYVPWLRALDAYGRSPELATELDYWKEICGITDGSSSVRPSTAAVAWGATGKTTLTADENQRLLELYQTPLARNGIVLAALCRAWTRVMGDASPLIMTEGHGRHPFPGTEPSTAVGWFAVRHPIGIPVRENAMAADLVDDAVMRLRAVPKLGHGYGLLRRKAPSDPLRVEMDKLRKPMVLLQYRGNIDETFRSDAVLPVIAVHHEGQAFNESCRNIGDAQSIAVMAGLSDGVLYWSVFYDTPDLAEAAQGLLTGMREFFRELAALE
ncbi:MAG: AMP-binding protein [Rhodospirillales bacterium]